MTGGSTKIRPRTPTIDPTNATLDQFLQMLQRRKILWELKLGVTQTQPYLVGISGVGVLLDGDTNPLVCRTLIGPIPAGMKVAVIFVPPAGYYIIGTVGGIPVGPLGLLEGVNVANTTGALNTAGSAETDIPQLSFSATLSPLRMYEIRWQFLLIGTVTTDTYTVTIRRDTAVSGISVGTNSGAGGTVIASYVGVPYSTTVNETVTFFFSHARRTGTGTFQAFGGPGTGSRTWAAIYDVGPVGNMSVV